MGSLCASICCTGTPVTFAIRRVPTFFTSSVVGCQSGSSTPALCAASFNCAMPTDLWSVAVSATNTGRRHRGTTQVTGPKSVEDMLCYLPKLRLSDRSVILVSGEDGVDAVRIRYFLPAAVPENSAPANHHHSSGRGAAVIWSFARHKVQWVVLAETCIVPAVPAVQCSLLRRKGAILKLILTADSCKPPGIGSIGAPGTSVASFTDSATQPRTWGSLGHLNHKCLNPSLEHQSKVDIVSSLE